MSDSIEMRVPDRDPEIVARVVGKAAQLAVRRRLGLAATSSTPPDAADPCGPDCVLVDAFLEGGVMWGVYDCQGAIEIYEL